jgi:hypothetical protein
MKFSEDTLKFLQMNSASTLTHGNWVTVGNPLRKKPEEVESTGPELTKRELKKELEKEQVRNNAELHKWAKQLVNKTLPNYDDMPFGAGR